MTTTTKTALSAALIELVRPATSFNTAAITPAQFGIEGLFGRFQDLRRISATQTPDPLAGLSFATVLDAVLDYRARNDRGFDVLNLATTSRSRV